MIPYNALEKIYKETSRKRTGKTTGKTIKKTLRRTSKKDDLVHKMSVYVKEKLKLMYHTSRRR